jgi:uncharacterized tellurite resistance protein B-like protein
MNIKNFTEQQQQALLDLALLAMYADGHLAAAEDERIHRLLGARGFTADYDRGKQYDAAIARVSRHALTADAARSHAITLVQSFTTWEQRRQVCDLLDDLVSSDKHVALQESNLLSLIREALQR